MTDSPAAPIDPAYDLAGYINQCADDGSMEQDPYSYAVTVIKTVLEYAMDDGINGSMSVGEFQILEEVGRKLIELDPAIEIDPRVA